jgi:hypothetical protein
MSHNRNVTIPSVFDKQKRRKPIDLGVAWSVVLVPLLFIVGGLSIPYSFCNRYLSARRERDFSKAMLGCNRTIPWPAFVTEMNSGVGTLILESASSKGPVRWWWTSQTLSTTLSGLVCGGDSRVGWKELEERWHAADKAAEEEFTGSTGTALLVLGTLQQRQELFEDGKLPKSWRRAHVGPSIDRLLMEFPETLV